LKASKAIQNQYTKIARVQLLLSHGTRKRGRTSGVRLTVAATLTAAAAASCGVTALSSVRRSSSSSSLSAAPFAVIIAHAGRDGDDGITAGGGRTDGRTENVVRVTLSAEEIEHGSTRFSSGVVRDRIAAVSARTATTTVATPCRESPAPVRESVRGADRVLP